MGDAELMACEGKQKCAFSWVNPFALIADYTPAIVRCDANATVQHTVTVVKGVGTASSSAAEIICDPGSGSVIVGGGQGRDAPDWARAFGASGVEFSPAAGVGGKMLIGVQGGAQLAAVGSHIDAAASVCADEGACVFEWVRGFDLGVKVVGTLQTAVYDDVTALGPVSSGRLQMDTSTSKIRLTFKDSAVCTQMSVVKGDAVLVTGSGLKTACVVRTLGAIGRSVSVKGCKSAVAMAVLASGSTDVVCDGQTATCRSGKAGSTHYTRWTPSEDRCDIESAAPVASPDVLQASSSILSGLPAVSSQSAGGQNGDVVSNDVADQINVAVTSAAAAGVEVFAQVMNDISDLGYAISYKDECGPCVSGPVGNGQRRIICLACASEAAAATTRQQSAGTSLVVCQVVGADAQRQCWREAVCLGEVTPGKPSGCSVEGRFETCPVCETAMEAPEEESVSVLSIVGIVALCITAAIISLLVCLVVVGVLCGVRRQGGTGGPFDNTDGGGFAWMAGDMHVKSVPVVVNVNDQPPSRTSSQFVMSPAMPLPQEVVADW